MSLLLKNLHIIAPHHTDAISGEFTRNAVVDIAIDNGIFVAIGNGIAAQYEHTEGYITRDYAGCYASIGFADLGTHIGEPGYEQRETITSATRAALRGGFTTLAVAPNTNPVLQTKVGIEYLRSRSKGIELLPIAALTHHTKGKTLTEMYDLHTAGTNAFGDGIHPIADAGVLMRALLYVRPFGGVVFNQPHDDTIAGRGQMHEGIQSTLNGMRGAPALAEYVMAVRDIELCDYTEGRLHLHCISAAETVDAVRKAKARGLQVTASVAVANLIFTDNDLHTFDTNYKTFPHLRTNDDRHALCEGLRDGTIDCIVTNHTPLEQEVKLLEFDYAAYGITMLETAFAASWQALKSTLSLEAFVEKWTTAPRRILSIPEPRLAVGATANLTIFDTTTHWVYDHTHRESLATNSPLIGSTLCGKVREVVVGNTVTVW